MYTYDPATIAPCELPIANRARARYFHLWHIRNAKEFCRQLLNLAAVPGISVSEYMAIADVANGKPWPVPDHPYTGDDWHRDRTFSAAPGQEIEEEIYWHMFEVLPVYSLPHCKRTAEYSAGFLMSEPVAGDPITGKTLYSAFGKRDDRYYYIGLLPCRPGEE